MDKKEKENKTDTTVETYNNIVKEYIEYFKTKDLGENVQFQKEIDYIVSELKENAVILDAGTATGEYPKYLTEKCSKKFRVVGIDAAKNMIEVAKNNARKAEFQVMDIRNLEFSKELFDVIICFATLTHVDDNECLKILNQFDRILKKNGLIAINVLELKNNNKEIFGKEPFNPEYKTYFNRYSKDFFRDYFSNKGYAILKFIDNPLLNPEKFNGELADDNQFSIIVRKNK
ncbi:MAG: methyltransferase domain-containing protein [Parcubacteria group bacterium]|jgi:ubiquinone/menaquinone biosynthesis C-methylase UbiE